MAEIETQKAAINSQSFFSKYFYFSFSYYCLFRRMMILEDDHLSDHLLGLSPETPIFLFLFFSVCQKLSLFSLRVSLSPSLSLIPTSQTHRPTTCVSVFRLFFFFLVLPMDLWVPYSFVPFTDWLTTLVSVKR